MQRALNSVSDWPEGICDAYVAFEREEGTLEQYDVAAIRVEAQMKRINERREKVANHSEPCTVLVSTTKIKSPLQLRDFLITFST